MKKTLLAVASALSVVFAGPVEAQNRNDVYRMGYFLLGTYLRASVVCDNKSLAEYGFSFVGSKEFRAFSAAYPQTYKKWMTEGGENFNSLVMRDGIPDACKFVISRMTRG